MSKRDREIVIHRVTGKHGAEHEWGLHATMFGHAAGLSEAQLDSTVVGPSESAGLWTRSRDDLPTDLQVPGESSTALTVPAAASLPRRALRFLGAARGAVVLSSAQP